MMSSALRERGALDAVRERALNVVENQIEWIFLPELLKKVAGFVPLDGPRFMLTCRGGSVAIRNGFGMASGMVPFCSYLHAAIFQRKQMADETYGAYVQAVWMAELRDNAREILTKAIADMVEFKEAVESDLSEIDQHISQIGELSGAIREHIPDKIVSRLRGEMIIVSLRRERVVREVRMLEAGLASLRTEYQAYSVAPDDRVVAFRQYDICVAKLLRARRALKKVSSRRNSDEEQPSKRHCSKRVRSSFLR